MGPSSIRALACVGTCSRGIVGMITGGLVGAQFEPLTEALSFQHPDTPRARNAPSVACLIFFVKEVFNGH